MSLLHSSALQAPAYLWLCFGWLQYAQRVRTIKNDATKNESNKEMLKLKKNLDYWKEQAGLPADKRDVVDLSDIAEVREAFSEE